MSPDRCPCCFFIVSVKEPTKWLINSAEYTGFACDDCAAIAKKDGATVRKVGKFTVEGGK